MRAVHLGDPLPFPETRYRIAGRPGGKQWVSTYMPVEGRRRKEEIAAAWDEQVGVVLAKDRPVRLDVILVFARPRGHYGSGRNAERIKPQHVHRRPGKGGGGRKGGPRTGGDADNCLKLVQDGLAGHAFENDGDVVDARVRKFYVDQVDGAEQPCTIIRLEEAALAREALDGPGAAQTALPLPAGNAVTMAGTSPNGRSEDEEQEHGDRVSGGGSPASGFPGLEQ